MRLDLGDLDLLVEFHIKDRPPPLRLAWTFGPVRAATTTPSPVTGTIRPAYLPPIPPPVGRLIVKDNQAVHASVILSDARGFPTTLDGVDDTISWTLTPDDGSVGTVAVDPDGMGATVTAVAPGDATLAVDVSLGDGRSVHGAAAIVVTAGDVAEVAVALGDPVDV